MLTPEAWKCLDETVYQIYFSEDHVPLRQAYLKNIAQVIHYHAAFFDLKGNYRGKTFYYDPIAVNFPARALDTYYAGYADKDYTAWALEQSGIGPVYRDSDLISASARERSAFYQEWLAPLGLAHGCGIIISYQGLIYGTVTFAREKGDEDFSTEDLSALDVTARHLCLRFHQLYPTGIAYGSSHGDIEDFQARYRLTPREAELCDLLCNGVAISEIARLLHISIHTVNRHIANIYQKVGVKSRMELLKRVSSFERI